MKFADTKAKKAPVPAHIVTLGPGAWSATYEGRPEVEVAIGMRLPSFKETLTAHTQATKEAAERPDEVFRFNEALVAWMLAACLCDVNDARKPYFEMADEEVRAAFPPETLRHLWHELEVAQLTASPARPQATDEDLGELAALLLDPASLEALTSGAAARVRRLLAYCLDELRDAATPVDAL